jgi:hypothetical protein
MAGASVSLLKTRPSAFYNMSVLALSEKRHLLGVFNWSDHEVPIVIPPGIDLPSQGIDVWSGEKHTISESTCITPHSAWLLEI